MNYYYNRPQVRFGPGQISPVVKTLIIANVAVFLLQSVLKMFSAETLLITHFGLVPKMFFTRLHIWQPVTYLFLHGNLMHVLFNMLFLWMFGTEVEQRMGSRVFTIYYFFCGIGAGLLTLVINSTILLNHTSALVPYGNLITSWVIPTIGASGAVFGVMLAYGMLFPNRMILLFFIIPVKAIFFVMLIACIEMYYLVFQTQGGISNAAHIGGMLFGFLFMRYHSKIMSVIDNLVFKNRQAREKKVLINKQEDIVRLNAILDKINRDGIHTLTPAEREFLRNHARRNRE
ncbi:MAG TPA: rhomboid family intramembrane serine protease [bacterium]|nr:rhomboid family intramembrane serine protease [bacterium]